LAALEGLRVDEYAGLVEAYLQLYDGGPIVLAEPENATRYTDRPLDPTDEADRLRMVFDTKPLEWFPMLGDDGEDNEHDDKLLRRYYDYLATNMPFPFAAAYVDRSSGKPVRCPFTVEKLIDPDVVDQANWNGPLGLYCSGADPNGKLIETSLQNIVCDNNPPKQFIEDYRSWIGI